MPKHIFKKGDPKPPTSGRKKGTPNKFTTVKQMYLDYLEEQGGVAFLRKIGKTRTGQMCIANNAARMLPKPVELSGPDGGPIQASISVKVNLVPVKKNDN